MHPAGYAAPPEVDTETLRALEGHAVAMARQVGDLLAEYFHRKLDVAYKSKDHSDPVTEADHAAERLITGAIRERFPDHGILTEETVEGENEESDFLWIIDPLDGTTNYLNHYPLFGSSIAVVHQGIPIASALFISTPLSRHGQVLHARLGGGAYVDETPLQIPEATRPSPGALSAMPAQFWGQFKVAPDLRRVLGELRVTGSVVYELALVATGALQVAGFGGPKAWDVAAGILVVQEARGQALVRNKRTREWQRFRSFLEPDAGLPADGGLRKWGAGLLVGGPHITDHVAASLRPRSKLRELWSWLRKGWPRTRARERHDAGRETETPAGPASPGPGPGGPQSPCR